MADFNNLAAWMSPLAPMLRPCEDSLAERFDDVAEPHVTNIFQTAIRLPGDSSGASCRAWPSAILFPWAAPEHVEKHPTPTEPIPEHPSDGDLLSALDRLPFKIRSVVLMVDVEEFSYPEASGILSISIGTVMSRLNQGRQPLREQFPGCVAES